MTFDDNRITKDMLLDLSKVHQEAVTGWHGVVQTLVPQSIFRKS